MKNGTFAVYTPPLDSGAAKGFDVSLTFIIPSKLGGEKLADLLVSIDNWKAEDDKLVVVANRMLDSELGRLKGLGLADLRILSVDSDFNFSHLVNSGTRAADTSHVLLLNDDISLLDPRPLTQARLLLAHSDIGVVGTALSYPNGFVQHVGISFSGGVVACHPFRGKQTVTDFMSAQPSPYLVSAVTFAFAGFSLADFRSLGGLDEKLPFGLQDVDFCLRMASDLGKKSVCFATTSAVHEESKSRKNPKSVRNLWPSFRDTVRFLQKHGRPDEKFFVRQPDAIRSSWRNRENRHNNPLL